MYVVNFDFSDHILPKQLLVVNLPVLVTELFTYPLQRLQTLLVATRNYVTNSQLSEAQLIIRNMISTEGFPKFLHGMRYSVDYTATAMTTKFLTFDLLLEATVGQDVSKASTWILLFNCYVANAFSTLMSQIAFNYQTIASSLPIDKLNRIENVKLKLQKYTMNKKNKLPIDGIRYTLPVSLINTSI